MAPHLWSLITIQRALPGCLIHTVAEETTTKEDLSYYVIEAWVESLGDVPTEADIDVHELGQGGPPKVLCTTTPVHLDSSTVFRPVSAERSRWTGGGGRNDDGDDFKSEQKAHPWTHGIADHIWHLRLEVVASGAAAG